jgi:hypothetical protein
MSDVGSDDLQREIQTLRNTASDFVNVVTSPAFLDALQAVNSAPEDQRLTEASKRLTPEALRDQGVPLPSDVRISSRYFEEGLSDPAGVELGEPPEGPPNLVNLLNKLQPGVLDRIRRETPEVFRAINNLGIQAIRSGGGLTRGSNCCGVDKVMGESVGCCCGTVSEP